MGFKHNLYLKNKQAVCVGFETVSVGFKHGLSLSLLKYSLCGFETVSVGFKQSRSLSQSTVCVVLKHSLSLFCF